MSDSSLNAGSIPVDPVYVARHPEIIATQGYLNDPIEFRPDQVLVDASVTTQVSSAANLGYQRDISGYLTVTMNDPSANKSLPITMQSPVWDRAAFVDRIDTTFRELT